MPAPPWVSACRWRLTIAAWHARKWRRLDLSRVGFAISISTHRRLRDHFMAKKLIVLAGPDEGMVFTLGSETLLLGRSRATETHLTDPHVSRVHCQIVPEGNQYVVVDFDSASGTFVNGKE